MCGSGAGIWAARMAMGRRLIPWARTRGLAAWRAAGTTAGGRRTAVPQAGATGSRVPGQPIWASALSAPGFRLKIAVLAERNGAPLPRSAWPGQPHPLTGASAMAASRICRKNIYEISARKRRDTAPSARLPQKRKSVGRRNQKPPPLVEKHHSGPSGTPPAGVVLPPRGVCHPIPLRAKTARPCAATCGLCPAKGMRKRRSARYAPRLPVFTPPWSSHHIGADV